MAKDRKNKDAQENGILKSKKPRKLARVLAVGLAILAVLGVVFPVFTACSNNSPEIPGPGPGPNPDNPPAPVEIVENVDDLMTNYGDEVNQFLGSDVLPEMIKNGQDVEFDVNKLVDATFDLGDGSATELDSVKSVFTYNVGGKDGNERYYAVNEMTFDSPLDLDDIAEYDKHSTELSQAVADAEITTEYSANYDAAFNYENTDLAQTIYDYVAPDAPDTTHLILNHDSVQGIINGKIVDVDQYTLIAQTDGSVTEYTLQVKDGVSVEEAFANNEYNLYTDEIENFESPVVYKEYVPEIAQNPVIDNLGELLTNYETEVQDFLKNNTTNAIIETLGHAFSSDLLKSVRYSIGDNDTNSISSIQIEFTLKDLAVEGGETYYRTTINFDSPVSLVDIAKNADGLNDSIKNATIENDVTFDYNAKDTQLRMDEVFSKLDKMGVSITDDMQVMANFASDGTCKIAIADDDGYTQYSFTASDKGSITEDIENADNVFVEKEYVEDDYEQGGSENPGGDIDINEDGATIVENLEPLLDAINQTAFSDLTMSNIRWDLGEPDENGNYDSIKIAFVGTDIRYNNDYYYVVNINLPYSLSADDLVNNPSAIEGMASQIENNNIRSEYFAPYNPTTLTAEQNNLVNAVAEHLITDNFNTDLDGTIKLYTDNGQNINVREFSVIFINDDGIREINFSTPYNANLNTIINYIENNQANIVTSKSVDFSDNQIEVDEIDISTYNEL